MNATWPGNVRELRNVLERACMLAEGRSLTESDLARCMPAALPPTPAALAAEGPHDPAFDLRSRERDHIVEVLRAERGNKRAAALKLGVSRRTLYRRLHRHQLPLEKHRD